MTQTRSNPVFAGLGTTIFSVMSTLAAQTGAINLGQGFPDVDGPESLRARAAQALLEESNQYPPSAGLPALRQAIARHGARHYGLQHDWESEVLVTSGATEALSDCLLALLAPGDEAILIEPAYDCYRPIVAAIGARPRALALRPPSWELPVAEMRALAGPRTRVIVLNSPHNPSGKVFREHELVAIADLARERDLIVVCDEVYEHLTFDGLRHVPLMTLPGMATRTLRVGSAGKIFSLTGWKVGWVTGPKALVQLVARAHQYVTFTTPPMLQSAVAHGLDHAQASYLGLAGDLQQRRDQLAEGLARAGFDVLATQGTYFLTASFWPLDPEAEDTVFCERLARQAGVAAIPLSAFYAGRGPQHLVRFAFCKRAEVLAEAADRLHAHFAA